MNSIDRKAFLLLASAIAMATVACSNGESDDTGSGSGAIENGGTSSGSVPAKKANPSTPTDTKQSATGVFERDGLSRLYVTAADQGAITFTIQDASGGGVVGVVSGKQAFFSPGNRFHWSPAQEGNCGLDIVPTANGYDVTEFVVNDGACDLHGMGGALNGHYGKANGAALAGHFVSQDPDGGGAQLDVTALTAASFTFEINATNASGVSGSVQGKATKKTDGDPSAVVYTFSSGSGATACSLTFDWGKEALAVEIKGCSKEQNGASFSRGYAAPIVGE